MKLTRCLPIWLMTSIFAFASPAPADTQESITPLAVGSGAPAAMVRTSNGMSVDLGAVVRRQPTVLIFYRGGWCPYCNTHLGELQAIEPALLALGFQILAVSADRPESMQPTTDKNHLSYRLLSDRGMNASAAYGVAFKVPHDVREQYEQWNIDLAPVPGDESQRWLPVPAVFLIGTDGTVRFAHSNPDYKQRIDTQELLAAARAALITD